LWLTTAAIIAALYVALTFLSMALGLDKNAIQVRFSETLVVLAFFTPAAIPGLTVGCLLANILTGCAPLDIVLGPIATLIGALGVYLISKMKNGRLARFICTLPNIIANTVIVTFICIVCYTAPEAREASLIPFYASTVFLGEVISSGILGSVILFGAGKTIKKTLNNT
jgi:uncharacterized membrane protein